EKKHCYFYFI
ncbi:Hypothetical protein EIN_141990, partial [Entamoeba invadens IP1]